jgi:hypothetical protein
LKDIKWLDLKREEDHRVNATVILENTEITDVPCKIYLPERIEEKPYLILKPPSEGACAILASCAFSLHATVKSFGGETQITVDAPKVYFLGGSTKYWGNSVSDSAILGDPQDLHVIHHLKDGDKSLRAQVVFWISQNHFLTPSVSSTSSYTGDLIYKHVREVQFVIKNEVKLVFQKHFRSKTSENGDFIQWAFLVACVELDCFADDVSTLKENVLPDIDDFLLIASFAARRRTACLGWSASDNNTCTTFYRGNYVFPDSEKNESLNNELIAIKDFERFMKTCYPAFLEFENKLAIRSALHSAVPSQSRTIEITFLRMFAGLETLILDFKRRKDLEYVMSPKDWPPFKKYLKKCIKNSTEPNLEAERRASMYRKLDELNRVSLREAYDLFRNEYCIDLVDLWPVFGESDMVGLVDIRNKLIHGDPFPHTLLDPLVVAKEHLLYTFERVLTRILKWNVAETKISPDYLSSYTLAIKDMPFARKKLTEHVNGGM